MGLISSWENHLSSHFVVTVALLEDNSSVTPAITMIARPRNDLGQVWGESAVCSMI
jgi:hypothetical protein